MNSQHEIIEQFRNAALSNGVPLPETITPDGALHRFKIDGKLNGAYVLHLDGRAAGYFEDFKQGIKQRWKAEGYAKKLTKEERQAFYRQRAIDDARRNAELAERHNKASAKANLLFGNAHPAKSHPYLKNKRIKPHGARVLGESLVIPLFDRGAFLVNLQFISPDGTKRFLAGGKKQGCYWWVGAPTRRVLIAEGFATAASIHQHTGMLTIVAFDAGNLKPVALTIRERLPDTEIIIMADNDLSGVGQQKALEAARAARCGYLVCPNAGQDFNDAINQQGA